MKYLVQAMLVATLAAGSACAQGHPGGGGSPAGGGAGGLGAGGPAGQPAGFGAGRFGADNPTSRPAGPPPLAAGGPASTLHGGLQLGPPGRWWDDSDFAKSIGLNREQQHRMDGIFKANKDVLVKSFKTLQREESALGKLSRARTLDEAEIDAQIDRVVSARGELEKANAHMLLEIRREMTPDQTARLEDHRPVTMQQEN